MAKKCVYNISRRCFHESCSVIDSMGNVSCCPLNPNPNGFLARRSVSPSHVSIFVLLKGRDKHGGSGF
jgi:hypothetical protein